MKVCFATLFLMGCSLFAPLWGAALPNVSGRWTVEIPGRRGSQEITLILNQAATHLEGEVIWEGRNLSSFSPVNTSIFLGKVTEDLVSFYVWEGRDQPKKAFYRGKIANGELLFTVTGGSPRNWGEAVDSERKLPSLSLRSPNFSGNWMLEMPRRWGGGVEEVGLVLNQMGDRVEGRILRGARFESGSFYPVTGEIWDGRVEGSRISFYLWTGDDDPVKTFYRGEWREDEILFRVTEGVPDLQGPEPAKRTARRTRSLNR